MVDLEEFAQRRAALAAAEAVGAKRVSGRGSHLSMASGSAFT